MWYYINVHKYPLPKYIMDQAPAENQKPVETNETSKDTFKEFKDELRKVDDKIGVATKAGLIDKQTGDHLLSRVKQIEERANYDLPSVKKLDGDVDQIIGLGKNAKKKELRYKSQLSRIDELQKSPEDVIPYQEAYDLENELKVLENELKYQQDPNNKKEAKQLGYRNVKQTKAELDRIADKIFDL